MATPAISRSPIFSPDRIANGSVRYSLAIVLFWIGGMKFTAYEAAGIQGLIATSPLMSWMYRLLSVRGASNVIGVIELAIAILILLRPVSPRAALIGGVGGIVMFLTTLSFMLSLPAGVWAEPGFPMLGDAGGFLIKDVVLLGTSIAIAVEAYSNVRKESL